MTTKYLTFVGLIAVRMRRQGPGQRQVDVRGAWRELLDHREAVQLSGAAAGAERRADLPDAGRRTRSRVG